MMELADKIVVGYTSEDGNLGEILKNYSNKKEIIKI